MNTVQIKTALSHTSLQHWLAYELFTWNWWFKIAVLVILIWTWWRFLDKKRMHEIVTYGLLVSLICMALDSVGTSYAFWTYPIRLLPVEFSEIHNFVLFPVLFMFIYQRYQSWKSFIIASAILSALLCFVGEVIAIWLKFYQEIVWRHIYSFPIYILIAILGKWIVGSILATGHGSQKLK